MSGPTREELDHLGGALRDLSRVVVGVHCTICDRAAQLIDVYPLPPEEEERESIRQALAELDALHAAANEADKIYTEALRRNEREGTRRMTDEEFKRYRGSGDRYRAAKERYERAKAAHYALLRAAAEELLRQPPPPPAAGVSKEAVKSLIGASCVLELGAWTRSPADLLADIEALPEAAPPQELVNARWQIAYMCEEIGTALGTRTQSPADTVGSVRLLMEHAERMKAREDVAPPSGVDREAAIEALQGVYLAYPMVAAREALVAAMGHIRALPEAQPAEVWHRFPELPPADARIEFQLWKGGRELYAGYLEPPDRFAIRGCGHYYLPAAVARWRYSPEPPPLPEAK